MFDEFIFRVRVWQLRRKLDRDRKPIIAAANKAHGNDDIEGWSATAPKMRVLESQFEEALAELQTQHLHKLAVRYLIPIPAHDDADSWMELDAKWGRYFSPKARLELRKQIHEERTRRRDLWMPVTALLIGFMAAATGLIAALSS